MIKNELSINWNLIDPKYKFAAMDENGEIYLYTSEPYIFYNYWDSKDPLKFFKIFMCDDTSNWKQSLTTRFDN